MESALVSTVLYAYGCYMPPLMCVAAPITLAVAALVCEPGAMSAACALSNPDSVVPEQGRAVLLVGGRDRRPAPVVWGLQELPTGCCWQGILASLPYHAQASLLDPTRSF